MNAQSFNGGLIGGFSTSQVDGDTYAGYHRIGLNVGAFVNHGLTKNLLWQMELKFIQKGSYKNQNPDIGDYFIYNLRLNYFEVPFLIRYVHKNKFSVEAGIAFGYLAKSKEGNQDGEFPYDPNIPNFHKFELSSQLGAYYYFTDNFWINTRYSYSILPIRPHASGAVYLMNRGEYNNVIQFALYYCFGNKND